ncbi:MAG: thioredoxin-disulfide reductase [Dehalococcoidia bacterium]|nr:thioredoxin-disulfide reductase [Dehalococcoidia bacterium]
MNKSYQLIIVGGGPAGLTAGLYAARSRLHTLLLEKAGFGGQITNAEDVDNFPGFPQGINGMELGDLIHKQATKYGLETALAEVKGIEVGDGRKLVRTSEGDFEAKAVIIAGGSEFAKLGVPGEAEYTGKGVSYCATCDGAFFRDQAVAVIGGGNAAVTEAIFLTKFASRVVLIHRRDHLRATKVIQEKAQANPKIEFILSSVVEAIEGDTLVRRLRLRNLKTKQQSTLDVSGVFVFVGLKPNTDYLISTVKLDDDGHIAVNQNMETSVPGIFAAGDIRRDSIKQAIAAAGDGAIAAVSAERYLEG